jgi:predicted RNA-binding protein YlxR (DUF448 family)
MERTCVGCRQRSERSDLLRIVQQANSLVFDEKKSMSGRGAWIHPGLKCLELAISRNALSRALRISGLNESAEQIIKEQAETMLAKNE